MRCLHDTPLILGYQERGPLAKKLGVSKSSVTLVRGITSRDKVVRIDGVTDREVCGRLC